MTSFEKVARHHYGHLPHDYPLMERIISFMEDDKLEELEKTYNDSSHLMLYSNIQAKWQTLLNREDITREDVPEFYTSETIEKLIFTLNMYCCAKARAYAAHRLDKKKR